jgi:hypothetical protein
VGDERFDLDLLDEEDPFEIDTQAGCLWFRWLPRAAVTRTDAVRSAAMRRRTDLLPSTGETDDEHAHDT